MPLPGGNIEHAPEEMKKEGAALLHLATSSFALLNTSRPSRLSSMSNTGWRPVSATHPIPDNVLPDASCPDDLECPRTVCGGV